MDGKVGRGLVGIMGAQLQDDRRMNWWGHRRNGRSIIQGAKRYLCRRTQQQLFRAVVVQMTVFWGVVKICIDVSEERAHLQGV
jgi:hypothetical protein